MAKKYLYIGQYYFDNLFELEGYPLPPLKKIGITDNPAERIISLSGTLSHINYTHLAVFDCINAGGANTHERALRAILASTRHGRSEWHIDQDDTLFNRFVGYCNAHGLLEEAVVLPDENGEKLVRGSLEKSDLLNLYAAFWDLFIPKAKLAGLDVNTGSARRDLTVKSEGASKFITVILNQGNHNLRVEIYNSRDPEKTLFDTLFSHKEAIEQELGYTLDWQRSGSKDASAAWRIACFHPNANIANRESWEEYSDWAIVKQQELIAVFTPYLSVGTSPGYKYELMRNFAHNHGSRDIGVLWDAFCEMHGNSYNRGTFHCQVGDYLKTGRLDTSEH